MRADAKERIVGPWMRWQRDGCGATSAARPAGLGARWGARPAAPSGAREKGPRTEQARWGRWSDAGSAAGKMVRWEEPSGAQWALQQAPMTSVRLLTKPAIEQLRATMSRHNERPRS
eukprot:gene23099-17100_t